jgi:DNA-binding NtrC family response regulator
MAKPGKYRVLVVDDEPKVCKSIRQVLLREDYEVDMALSGEEALSRDAERSYDVVVVDLMMPGRSGMDLLEMLKAANPKVRIIMVTGYPTMRNMLQAINLGAVDFLPKPFLPATLRDLVAAALEAGGEPPEGHGAAG